MSVEWLLITILLAGVGFLVFGRLTTSRVRLLGALFMAAGLLAVWSWQGYLKRKLDSRTRLTVPHVGRPEKYVGSVSCRACHPDQYTSWHRSFHRTMTQIASTESVRGNFDGVALEFAYLNVSNETRRLMWTLAHAHGTLLGLVNVLVGLSIRIMPEVGLAHRRLTSAALLAATVLIPGGFFLGGVVFYGGDPGLGVLILPIGAVALLVAAFRLARTAGSVSSAAAAPSIRAARPPKR